MVATKNPSAVCDCNVTVCKDITIVIDRAIYYVEVTDGLQRHSKKVNPKGRSART